MLLLKIIFILRVGFIPIMGADLIGTGTQVALTKFNKYSITPQESLLHLMVEYGIKAVPNSFIPIFVQ